MKKSLIASVSYAILIIAAGTAAQQSPQGPANPETPKIITGGVLNGKAVSLPKPIYPHDAAAAGANGQVSVKVLIDETGAVLTAEAMGGVENIPLRRAAEAAALQAKFSPTTLSGQPVKVSGVITYNFVLERGNNEDKVKVMSAITFLTLVRGMGADFEKLDIAFEEKRSFETTLDEITGIKQLVGLRNLRDQPIEKRLSSIDEAIFSLRTESGEADKWQVTAGDSLGKLFAMLFNLMAAGGEPDLTKLSESDIRTFLSQLKKAASEASKDVPQEIIVKLELLGKLADSKEPIVPERLEEMINRVGGLVSAITGN